jgi:hypothetical protein
MEKELSQMVDEAVRNHQFTFVFVLAIYMKSGDQKSLEEWFEMIYNCYREYKCDKKELEEAKKIFLDKVRRIVEVS